MNFFFVTFLLLCIPLFVTEAGKKSQNGGGSQSDAGSPSSRSPAREGGGTSSRKRLLRWASHAIAGRKSDSSAARDLVGDSGHKSLQSTMSLDPRAEWRGDEDVMKMMKQKYRKQLENKGNPEIITKAGSKPLVHYFLDKAEANDMDNEESVPFFKDGKFMDIPVDLEKMKRNSGLVKALAKSRMSREEENSRDPNTERWNRPGRVESLRELHLREVEANKQMQKLLEDSQKNLGMAGGGGKEEEEEERKGKKPVEIVDQQRSSQLLTKFADQTDDGAKESPGKSQKEAEASMGKRPKKEMPSEGQKSPGKTESSDVGEPAEEVGEDGEVFELGSINEEIASRRSSQQEEVKAVDDEHQHKLAKENAMQKPELGEYSTHLINSGLDQTESPKEHAKMEKTVKSDDALDRELFAEEPMFHNQTDGDGQLAEHVKENDERARIGNKREIEAGKEEKVRHPINRHPINAAGSLGMAEEKASEQNAIEEVGREENPIANSMAHSPRRKPPAVEQSHFHVGNENVRSKKKAEEEEEELIKAKSLAHPHQLAKAQHKTLHIGAVASEQTPFEVQGNEAGDENVATVPLAQSPKREPSMVEGVNAVVDLAAPSPRGRPSAVEENLGVAGHNNEEIDGKKKAEEVKEREEVKPGNQEGHRHLLVDERRAENVGNSATDSEAHHPKGKPGANTHSLLMRFPAEREKPSRDGLPIVLPIPSPALRDAKEFEEGKGKQMKVGEPKEVSEKKAEDAKAVKELIARFNHPNLEKSPPKQPLLPASRSFVNLEMLRSEQPIRRAGGSFDGLYGSSGEKDKIRRGCKITRAIENPGRGGGTRRTLCTKPTSTAGDHQVLSGNDENRKVVGEDN